MPEQGAAAAGGADGDPPAPDSARRAAVLRGVAFFVLWQVLIQSLQGPDLVFGACVAAAATWASLRLLPPDTGNLRFARLLLLLPHFLWQSVRAGADVAARALSLRVRLRPGLVRYPVDFPPGQARNTFATVTSLMPGTVPSEEVAGELVYHCLDTAQPVIDEMRQEERRLASALVAGRGHG